MGDLRSLPLRISYRTGRDDLVRDFYVPALRAAVLYRRAAGYFTSAGLSVAAQGVADLAARGGRMLLVASPHLDDDDITALQAAQTNPQDILASIVIKGFQQIRHALEFDRLNALAWLSAAGLLEVKLALRLDNDGHYCNGIYHEKMGVLTDSQQNHVAFSGSSNETAGGLIGNFESIKVFRSWEDGEGRVAEELENFALLWNDTTPELKVIDFSEATQDILRPYKQDRTARTTPKAPPELDRGAARLWEHQERALAVFLTAKAGVIEMATGTGKTRLALAICQHLSGTGEVKTIIVSTDGLDLLDQWYQALLQALESFGEQWAIYRHYGPHKNRSQFLLLPERSVMLVSREFLPVVLNRLPVAAAAKTILIHDEVHGLGSPSNRKSLAGTGAKFGYRLGLSATPEREYDADGNDFIQQEIGPILFQFGLDDAIRKRILVPFEYCPIDYLPDDEDGARIQRVYALKAARQREGKPMSQEEFWTELAKVYKTSKAKLVPFRQLIAERPDLLTRCVIFVETREYGEAVLDIVHQHRHDFHTYFGGEDSETLRRFARGEIECLLTCHRLSEGIDIQTLSNVILFASARSRLETIQRIGRCLRQDPSAPNKVATVVDFVRQDQQSSSDHLRAAWLTALSDIRFELEPIDAKSY
jgi:superfamily II DNA or RNA helicase